MTAEVIEFPDVEDACRRHLAPLLPGVAVYAGTTPRELPIRSVTVIRTGGAHRSLILDDAQVSFDCRAASKPGAALNLASQVRSLLSATARDGWLADVVCYRLVETSAPYSNPDPAHPAQHRVSLSATITVRGS